MIIMEVCLDYFESDFSEDMLENTVRFLLVGKGAALMKRETFLSHLNSLGMNDNKIGGMWMGESPFECFVYFNSVNAAMTMLDFGRFTIGETAVFPSKFGEVQNEVRVHWVPAHMKDPFLNHYFEGKGFRVLSIETEQNWEGT